MNNSFLLELKTLAKKLKEKPLNPVKIDPISRNFEKITILKRKYSSK